MDLHSEADAPPRKPKQPFLKRGEGVRRRLDAYKYRKPSTNEGSSHDEEAQLSVMDQGQQHGKHVGQYGRGGEHSAPDSTSKNRDILLTKLQSGSAGQRASTSPQKAAATWTTHQAKEDLELEEFRALEREIWGGRQQLSSQQQKQQWPDTNAEAVHHTTEAAEAAALAAYNSLHVDTFNTDVDLGQSSSSQLITFQDDTEWVDTEFSFAGMPDQSPAATDRPGHVQQEQQHLSADTNSKAARKPGDGALAQPYVRAVFAAKGLNSNRSQTSSSNLHSRQTNRLTDAAALPDDDALGLKDAQQQMMMVAAEQVQKWQQLEEAQPNLQKQQDDLRRMRHELKSAATRLEQERQAWETQKAAAQASMDAWRSEEARRLARERRVLEQQSKALLKLPNKKEKSAMEALEQQLEKERAEARAAAARHKLTVERLRCQIKELQDRNNELREEVRWHEAQQLNATAFAAADPKSRKRPPTSVVQTQTEAWLAQDMPGTAAAAATAIAAALRLEPGSGQHHLQQQTAAAATHASLYEALFGEEEDTEFAAAEAMAAAAAAEAESHLGSGQPILLSAQQPAHQTHQPPQLQHSNGLDSCKSTSHRSGSNIQQQQPPAVGAQLGRRIENDLTLKAGHNWVGSPLKQPHMQHYQQPAQMAAAVQSVSAPTGIHTALPNGRSEGHEQQAHDDFTFAPVAPPLAAASNSTRAWDRQQERHQQPSYSNAKQLDADLDGPKTVARHDRIDHYEYDTRPQLPSGSAKDANSRVHPQSAAESAADLTEVQSNRPAPAATGRSLLQESQHCDGKLEQLFSDGSRVLHFANGTVKVTYADGSTCIRFSNGDIKRETAEDRVDYYYAEVATWQSSHPDCVEVYYFPTGQVEGHYGDGKIDIIFPDGSIRRVLPDGCEQEITAASLPAAVLLPPPDLDRF